MFNAARLSETYLLCCADKSDNAPDSFVLNIFYIIIPLLVFLRKDLNCGVVVSQIVFNSQRSEGTSENR